MKRKLPLILIILVCFCALTVLTSCDAVLDLIFGPKNPTNPPNTNEPPAHTHSMVKQTFTGETCVGQSEITYYKCSGCNKCFMDEAGNEEIADLYELDKGHFYVIKTTDNEHYHECSLCHTEQENSRGRHSSDRWWYNPDNHYKICDVCGIKFNVGSHDETGSCSVCGRQADYKTICNGSYGYEQLAELENGANMQKLYNKIDEAVSSAHDNERLNATRSNIGEDAYGQTVYAYALNKVSSVDCSLSATEAYVTVASYNHDHPLYYWIDKQCSVSVNSLTDKVDGITICVVEDYANGQDRARQNSVLYNEIDKYLSEVSNQNDPYYVTLGLHDAIIDSIDYAYKSDGTTAETAHWAHSVVGVLDKKSAVCEGYAKAFQLLLNACNVDNVYVTGSSKNVGHAWNTVKLADGSWYWYDLTWDDQPNLTGGKYYDYFCKTDAVFSRDHNVTQSNVKDNMNYLYPLPQTSSSDYSASALHVGEEVTLNNVTYALAGYDRLAVTKVLTVSESGVVELPSSVEHNGSTFTVRQINGEALATYTYGAGNVILSIAHPSITKIVIPETVDTIYNKSFVDCKTLKEVQFKDVGKWYRYALDGKTPAYQQIPADKLSVETSACKLIQELYKTGVLSSSYVYVWTKIA